MRKNLATIMILIVTVLFVSQTETKAQDPRPFPIPQLSNEMARVKAESLQSTMNEMRQHLCDKPERLTNDWQNKFDDLLVDLIVNEHRLVWAKVTDLNAEEKRLYEQFFGEKRKIGQLFARHLQTNPELKTAVEEYEKPNNLLNRYKGRDGYGRAVFMIHAMLFFDKDYPPAARVSAQTMSDLGVLGEYTAIRFRMVEVLAQTHRLLHERGIAEINQIIPQNSRIRFSIHLTPDRLKQRVLEELIRMYRIELGVPLVKERAITLYESDEWVKNALFVPTAFDDQQQDLLRGECDKKTDKRRKSIRIVFTESRLTDATRAAQLLRENGFSVIMFKATPPVNTYHQSKLFINLSIGGTEKEGEEIAEIIKNIEKLIPSASTTITHTERELYFLWIVRN